MNYRYSQKFIKVLALLAITNAFFVGNVVHAYTPLWTDFRTNNYVGGNSFVTKNATFWEVTIASTTQGGIIIGDPFYKQPLQITNVSPLTVDFQVMSNSNCVMRYVTSNSTNGVTGSSVITLTPGSRATTSITFTSPSVNNGISGMAVYRNAGTADCVVRFYSITAFNGQLLWSPTQNLDTYSGILQITNVTSTTSGDTTINMLQPETEEMINFVLLLFTYVIPLVLFIYLTRKFYVRE